MLHPRLLAVVVAGAILAPSAHPSAQSAQPPDRLSRTAVPGCSVAHAAAGVTESIAAADVVALEVLPDDRLLLVFRSHAGEVESHLDLVRPLGEAPPIHENFAPTTRVTSLESYRGTTQDGRLVVLSLVDGMPFGRVERRPSAISRALAPTSGAGGGGGLEPQSGTSTWPVVEIALDADFEFFWVWGQFDYATALGHMANTFLLLDFVFMREIGVRYQVSFYNIWTIPDDFYWSFTTKDLVNGMQSIWNQIAWWVHRDTAHLFSGKFMDKNGGTPNDGSYPGHICNVGNAYSVSSPVTVDQSGAYSIPPTAYQVSQAMDALLFNVVHEQGHQWGAEHCYGVDCIAMCGDASCPFSVAFGGAATAEIYAHLGSIGCLDHVPVPSGSGLPDLRIAAIHTDPVFAAGVSPSITVEIENAGGKHVDEVVMLWSWLTLDGDPFSGPPIEDIPMGGPNLNNGFMGFVPGFHVDLAPGETKAYPFEANALPGTVLPTTQTYVAWIDAGAGPCGSVCESDEWNNLASVSVPVIAEDAEVLGVYFPNGDDVLEDTWVVVQVDVRNNGGVPRDIPVGLAAPLSFETKWAANVDPGETVTLTFSIWAPFTACNCATTETFFVNACANLSIDHAPWNNCKSADFYVTDQYYDIRLSIENDQPCHDSLCFLILNCEGPCWEESQGQDADFLIVAENVGTVASPAGLSVDYAIVADNIPGSWFPNTHPNGIVYDKSFGSIAPGEEVSIYATYPVGPIAYLGDQYLKVFIDQPDHWAFYPNFSPPDPPEGPGDVFTAGNEAIQQVEIVP